MIIELAWKIREQKRKEAHPMNPKDTQACQRLISASHSCTDLPGQVFFTKGSDNDRD